MHLWSTPTSAGGGSVITPIASSWLLPF